MLAWCCFLGLDATSARTHTHSHAHALNALIAPFVSGTISARCRMPSRQSASYPVDILAPWPLPFTCTPYSTSTMYSTMYSAMYPLIPSIPGIVDKALQAPPPPPKSQVLRHGSSHASAIASSSSLRQPSDRPVHPRPFPFRTPAKWLFAVLTAQCAVSASIFSHLGLSSSWHITTLARRLGQPRCSRSSVHSRITSQGAPDAPPRPRLLARSFPSSTTSSSSSCPHARAILYPCLRDRPLVLQYHVKNARTIPQGFAASGPWPLHPWTF